MKILRIGLNHTTAIEMGLIKILRQISVLEIQKTIARGEDPALLE